MPEPEIQKPKGFRSLTVTLAITFLTLSVIILLIASSLQIYFNLQAQQKLIAGQLQYIAQNAANTVSSFIEEKFSILEVVAKTGHTTDVAEQKRAVERLMAEPAFRQLLLLGAQGQELLKVSRLSRFELGCLRRHALSDLFSYVSRGETYISSICIDETTSEPMVALGVPVTNIFGDFQGFLVAELNLKFMWTLIERVEIGETGAAYVVDRTGDLIAFGDISRVLKRENLIELKEVAKFVKGEELPPEIKAEISKGIHGTNVLATYVPLGMPDWAVLVELPIAEAYETVIFGTGLSIVVIILLSFLAIMIGIYLSKRITRPILNLRDAAIEIGRGKLDTEIEIQTKDEIGELAFTLNQMTKDLRESRRELEKYSKGLEKTVEERTKELESKMAELEKFNRFAVGRELRMTELKERIKKLEEQLKKTKPKTKVE